MRSVRILLAAAGAASVQTTCSISDICCAHSATTIPSTTFAQRRIVGETSAAAYPPIWTYQFAYSQCVKGLTSSDSGDHFQCPGFTGIGEVLSSVIQCPEATSACDVRSICGVDSTFILLAGTNSTVKRLIQPGNSTPASCDWLADWHDHTSGLFSQCLKENGQGSVEYLFTVRHLGNRTGFLCAGFALLNLITRSSYSVGDYRYRPPPPLRATTITRWWGSPIPTRSSTASAAWSVNPFWISIPEFTGRSSA